MKKATKTTGGVLIAIITLLVLMLCFSLTPSAEEGGAQNQNNDKTINVWLIGGQSNAVGYGKGAPAEAETDTRFYTGFDNVLYYGNHEQWKYNEDNFVPTTIGLGRTADNNDVRYTSSGAEIGIAKALADTGEMNAIIKFAYGGTYLYPKQSASVNDNAKTWTSPSYIAAHPEVDTGNNIGALYDVFVSTVTEGIAKLEEAGYTPVIKGMWWMQGENEGMNETHAAAYEELLTCLINDVRAELQKITGEDYSDMPFICQNVCNSNNNYTAGLTAVNAAQASVAANVDNVAVITVDEYSKAPGYGHLDQWHYNVDTYNYIGKTIVKKILNITNESIISASGEGIVVSGAGIKSENGSAVVTITAKDGYTINSVKLSDEEFGTSGTYNVTLSGSNVTLTVDTTYTGTDATTDYGTIPAVYNNPEKYPFVLFKNGSFIGAYEYYGKALADVPVVSGADNYNLLLRRDYTTVTADATTAPTYFGGTFTLDLGTNTMVRGNRAYIFEINSNNNSTYSTSITVKNGSMYSSGDFSLISLNYDSLSNVSKTYCFNFMNVVFSTNYRGRGSAVIFDTLDGAATTDSAGLTAIVSFDGCTFDFGETSGTMMKFSNGSAAKTVVTAEIAGGSIVSKTASYTLYSATAEDNVTIAENDGKYPTVTLPTGVVPPTYTYTAEGGKIYGIAADSGIVSGENTVYTMGEQSLNTKYGAIGESFKDSQTYKFALFKTDSSSDTGYTFVAGYTTFGNACKAAGLKGAPVVSGVDFVILVRTSFTQTEGVDNMQNFYNNVVIDLGGNLITLTTQHFLPLYLGNPSSATTYGKITIKNGTILNNSPSNGTISAIRVDSGTLTNNLTYNVDAENVTFKVATGSKSANGAISMSDNKGTAKLTLNCTLTNCTFDYTDAPSNTVMINAGASQRVININLVGGSVIANSNNAFKFISVDNADTVYFKANSNGATTNFLLNAEAGAPTNKIGNLDFIKTGTVGEKDAYGLVEKHVYGDIPANYAAPDDYPVLLFKADKTFVRGYASFAEAAIAAGLVNGGAGSQVGGADAIILFRRDHEHVGESGNMNCYYNNVTIDLGGFTVQLGTDTVKKNFLVLYPNSAPENGTFGTITVKNGTFKNMWNNTAPICFNGGGNVGNNIVYTVNYENVKFTVRNYSSTIYGAIRTWGDSAKNITLNATYTDCCFDYTGSNTNSGMFGLSYNSKTTTVFNVTINGGEIIAGSNNAFNFIEADSLDNVTLGKDETGNYTTLSMTSGTAPHTAKYNDGAMSFVYSKTVSGNDIYELSEASTHKFSIGLADSSMSAMANYALFVYVNGNLVSLPYSAELVSGTEVTIVARGTCENNYAVTINGKAAGELKLTLSEDTAVSVGIVEKSTVNKINVSNVTSSHSSANDTSWAVGNIIDGNRVSGGSSFGYSTGALNTQSLSNPVVLTFDLGTVRKINQIAIFPRSDTSATGGLLSCNYPVDFTISVSENGSEYVTVRTVTGETAPVFPKQYCYSFADTNAQYVRITITKVGHLASNEANSTRYRVQLAEVEVYYNEELATTEEYSLNISAENTEMAKYALTLYVNGKLSALPYTATLERGDKITILAKGAGNKNYIVTINGTQTEELTIEMLDDTNIVIGVAKNPNAVKIPISSVTPSDKGYESNSSWKSANLIDGVISNGYTTGWKNNPDVSSNPFTLTFDLGSIKRINQVSIYPRMDTATVKAITESSLSAAFPRDFTISVSVDGTKYVNVLSVTDYETPLFRNQQSFNFEDIDARYVKLTVTKLGAAAHDDASAGRYRLQLTEFEVYYNSDIAFVNTEYGTVTGVFANENNYPIAVFKTDKTLLGAYATYKEALDAAFNGTDCIILFRRDYTHVNSNKMIGAYYNDVTIDLGGKTVTLSNQHFLALYGSGSPTNATFGTITVKNGTFINNSANNTVTPVRLDGKWSKQVIYNVNLKNVKFVVASASGSSLGAVSTANANGTNNVLNVTLTDCIFDFANSKSGTVMISASGSRTVNATIYGGKILAGANNSFNLVTNDNTDKIAFAKNDNEEYVKLILDKSTSAPSINAVYTTADGVECVFVKASEEDNNANYVLYPKVMLGYKIKTSVTLYSNFVYNIYIPETNFNKAMINGNDVEVTLVTIDGANYYHAIVNIPAANSLADINLTVTLNSGSTTVNANWTLSVFKYAKSVIGGDFDQTEKTLMKDMLAYASAAHTYFKNTADVADKLAEIESILDEYKQELPTGESKKPDNDTYFTSVAVYLGEVPSFRFYLAENYTADDFTFKVGNKNATVIEGDGYVEIVMYAYMMLDDVTFTVKGTNVTQSYNLYAYYEFAKTLEDATLVNVVEGLMKYSASAKAYRDFVIGK